MSAFGPLLEKLILSRWESINSFAQDVGPSQSHVANVIGGIRSASLADIERWANALKLEGDERIQFRRLGLVTHIPKEGRDEFDTIVKEVAELKVIAGRLRKRRQPDRP